MAGIFMVSHGTKHGAIMYMAGVAEAFEGEGKSYGGQSLTIPAGEVHR